MRTAPHILMTDNTSRGLLNFREGLIQSFLASGVRLTVVAPEDEASSKLQAMGCRFFPIRMERRSISPRENARLIREFTRIFAAEKPDAILSYTIKNNIFGGIAARQLDLPFYPMVTGLGATFSQRGALNHLVCRLYRYAFRPARRVFFLNQSDLDVFLDRRLILPEQAILLPGEGVDTGFFSPRPAPQPAGDTFTFLFCGRLIREKGIGEFAMAARHLAPRYPQLAFRAAGPFDQGNPDSVTPEDIAAWQANPAFRHLGALADVRPALAAADCVVLPSYYPEGVPRILMEASAMERPIITTDTPGCRDVVLPQSSGLLCQPRSVASLIAAMEQMLGLSAQARLEMGRAGRAHAIARFSQEEVTRRVRALLDSAGFTGSEEPSGSAAGRSGQR